MTDPDKTLIAVLLDRSGSMMSVKTDTEGGFDQFIADQRSKPGSVAVTLAQFDTEYELVYSNLPIAQVPRLELTPRGSTALYDGIGKLSTDVGTELAATPHDQRPAAVLVVILTDGYENASREWDHAGVRALIRQQTEVWKWTYLFLGADLSAVPTAVSLGIDRSQALHYSPSSTAETFNVAAAAVSRVRGGTFVGFTDHDRDIVGGDHSRG